ncbi:MAG: phospholipid carrier-dependent glycosyltransferase [bacterium]|nr:phospholipid carrier-dependent glycosyltransferase [bacterium]
MQPLETNDDNNLVTMWIDLNKNKLSQKQRTRIYSILILAIAVFIGTFNVTTTGVQWPEDGSRYLNNAAMVRDYLLSSNLLAPIDFAMLNYAQYPAFSIPYHPPGYALMLAVWFILFGMSYVSARFFIAFFLGLAGISFHRILQRLGLSAEASFWATLVFLSTFEVARWGRSTMSEIPALAFIMLASYLFITWIQTDQKIACWLSFAAMLAAFFCRVTAIGIIPGWVAYLVLSNRYGRLFSAAFLVPASACFAVCFAWVQFASRFARYEVRSTLLERLVDNFSLLHISGWMKHLSSMTSTYMLLVAIAGFLLLWRARQKDMIAFWGSWFLGFYVFTVIMTNHFEARYFVFAIPAVVVLAMGFTQLKLRSGTATTVIATLLFIPMMYFNITAVWLRIPIGVIGHEAIAERLQRLSQPGNILLSCWNDSDLIFRYRCRDSAFNRRMVRGDRTVSIRLSSYAGVEPQSVAHSHDDVLDIIRKGRIRYILTSSAKVPGNAVLPADMRLVHSTMASRPDLFKQIDEFTLRFNLHEEQHATVFLWQYEGPLDPGESQLPVVIPTARIVIK